jgi:hypothetical protein
VARITNRGNKDDSALLIDAPLPKSSPYQKAKKELEEKKKKGQSGRRPRRDDNDKKEDEKNTLEEPVQKWALKDHAKQTLLELQVVRIDERNRVIFQVDGKFFAIRTGESLLDAMRKENDEGALVDNDLSKEELKKLGLVGDPSELQKKVKLTELKFNKERKGFEGTFLYSGPKDEKRVLSVDTLPEQFEPPSQWVLKDNFGAEAVKLTVVRIEKDRLLFEVDKKFYTIKAGSTLHEAMAKPLSESEVKALKLKE